MQIHASKNNVNYDILKNIFKNISEDKLDFILKYSTIRKYQKGDLILNKENCHTALYRLCCTKI